MFLKPLENIVLALSNIYFCKLSQTSRSYLSLNLYFCDYFCQDYKNHKRNIYRYQGNLSIAFPLKSGIKEGLSSTRGYVVCNGNRTEWSPIRSVIIRVINKIGRPRSRSPICLITSMITDQKIGRASCRERV